MRRWILAFVLVGAVGASSGCGPSYPNCERQEHCPEEEHCVMQQCQQCAHANHCSASQRCVEGRCQ